MGSRRQERDPEGVFQALQYPVGWCWAVLLVLAGVLWRRRCRGPALAQVGVCLGLTLLGGTPLSGWLVAGLERPYVGVRGGLVVKVDAIVVLGGMASASEVELEGFETGSAFDRVVTGLGLVERGWSRELVLGGGISTRGAGGPGVPDSEAMRPWLERRLGGGGRLHVLPVSRTTRDEAVHGSDLAKREGWRRVALVTSGYHLPRAVSVFRARGLEVEPVGCDFEGLARMNSVRGWTVVPNNGDLRLAGIWLHEVVGRGWYGLRGWME